MPARRRVHVLLGALLLSGLPVMSGAVTAPAAQAHQDGCHRWHSCPSDTGSYECGDLGDFSECGGAVPQDTTTPEPAPEPAPVVDYDPPRRPRFGHALSGLRGLVRIPVRAEAGSRLVVRSGSRTLATLTATGAQQTITMHATTGSHLYRAVATDSAGNTSTVGTIRVHSDATPPATYHVTLQPGSPTDSRTAFAVDTEPGTNYELSIDRRTVQHGVTVNGAIEKALTLPDGPHRFRLALRDEVGN